MENQELAVLYTKTTDPKERAHIRARLVVAYNYLIIKFGMAASQSTGVVSEIEDVKQAARLGFLRALENYDPSKAKLSTHVFFLIRHEVQWHCYHATRLYRTRKASMPAAMRRIEDKIAATCNRPPTAEELGCTEEELVDWRKHEKAAFVSLDATSPLGNLRAHEPDFILHEVVGVDVPTVEDAVVEAEERQEIRDAVAALDPEVRAVIDLTYLQEMSQTAVRKQLGLTKTVYAALLARGEAELREALG